MWMTTARHPQLLMGARSPRAAGSRSELQWSMLANDTTIRTSQSTGEAPPARRRVGAACRRAHAAGRGRRCPNGPPPRALPGAGRSRHLSQNGYGYIYIYTHIYIYILYPMATRRLDEYTATQHAPVQVERDCVGGQRHGWQIYKSVTEMLCQPPCRQHAVPRQRLGRGSGRPGGRRGGTCCPRRRAEPPRHQEA